MASEKFDRINNSTDTDKIGEHPVGTGVGAAGGGAAGAAVGMAAGPVGAVVGAVAGAIAGGLGGKAATDAVVGDKDHDAYWQQNFKSRPYYQQGKDYTHYAPAYQHGYTSHQKYGGKSFDEVEAHLRTDWESTHAKTAGSWETSRLAVRDAYDRVGTARTATAQSGTIAVPVTEERLSVGKQQVETGGVRVSTHVEERPVEAQVNLREEHVNVQRRAVDRPATEADFNRAATANLEVTETAERAVVSKEARVVEEIEIGKQATERTETVRDTVRKTEVDVQKVDRADVTDKTNVDAAAHSAATRKTKDTSR
jgi:uncharacterized protein (TIGR02271 family)